MEVIEKQKLYEKIKNFYLKYIKKLNNTKIDKKTKQILENFSRDLRASAKISHSKLKTVLAVLVMSTPLITSDHYVAPIVIPSKFLSSKNALNKRTFFILSYLSFLYLVVLVVDFFMAIIIPIASPDTKNSITKRTMPTTVPPTSTPMLSDVRTIITRLSNIPKAQVNISSGYIVLFI